MMCIEGARLGGEGTRVGVVDILGMTMMFALDIFVQNRCHGGVTACICLSTSKDARGHHYVYLCTRTGRDTGVPSN